MAICKIPFSEQIRSLMINESYRVDAEIKLSRSRILPIHALRFQGERDLPRKNYLKLSACFSDGFLMSNARRKLLTLWRSVSLGAKDDIISSKSYIICAVASNLCFRTVVTTKAAARSTSVKIYVQRCGRHVLFF